jgi:hypothetical protein
MGADYAASAALRAPSSDIPVSGGAFVSASVSSLAGPSRLNVVIWLPPLREFEGRCVGVSREEAFPRA